ncbi:MAG: hypothetical protein ACREJN_21765 [Nitrospiraceae bacterium]
MSPRDMRQEFRAASYSTQQGNKHNPVMIRGTVELSKHGSTVPS